MEDSVLSQLLLDWDDADFALLSETVPFVASQPPIVSASESPSTADDADGVGPPVLRTEREAQRESTATDRARDAVSRSTLCRKRQREELDWLCAEAASLENQLQDMRTRTRPTESGDELLSPHQNVWKRLATHQLERRRAAERENSQLRELLNEQNQVAKRLSRALAHARSVDKVCKEVLSSGKPTGSGDAKNFVSLPQRTIAAWWPRIEHQVFRNSAFWMEDLERGLVRITDESTSRTTVECAFTTIFPFDVAATSAALWQNFSITYQPMTLGHYEATTASDSLLLAGFDLLLKNGEGRAVTARSKFFVRRVQNDPNRVIVLWEDVSSSDADLPEDVIDVKINGCVCLDRYHHPSMPQATKMRVYALQNIVGHARAPISTDELESSLAEAYCETHRKTCRDLETTLVDESLRHRAHKVSAV